MSFFKSKYDSQAVYKLINLFSFPAILINSKLEIVAVNDLLNELLIQPPFNHLTEILAPEIFDKLEKSINSSLFKKESLLDEKVFLVKTKFPGNNYSLSIYYYPILSNDHYLLILKNNISKTAISESSDNVRISFLNSNSEIYNIIPISLMELLESVSDIIPLSFTNKNKVKNLLDTKDEIIWLKDINDNIVLANKKYFEIIGKNEKEVISLSEDFIFFPYQNVLLKHLSEYSKTNRKPILISGIKYSLNINPLFPLLIYPVADKQSKNYVFFYIILAQGFHWSKSSSAFEDAKYPLIRFNKDKKILSVTSDFKDLLDIEKHQNINNISELFDKNVLDKIEEHIISDTKDKSIYLDSNFKPSTIENCDYIFHITENQPGIYDALIYPIKQHSDLKFIISQRGKMLDYYIQNSPESIFVFDKESLKFLEVNQSTLNLYGYKREEFLKLDLIDLFSPEDFHAIIESLRNSNSQRTTQIFKQRTKDGNDIYVKFNYNEFKYNDLDSMFVIVEDVTKNIELEREILHNKELIENISDIIIETDLLGFIKYYNKNALKELGYKGDKLTETSFSSLLIDDQRGIINSELFNSRSGKINQVKTSIKKADGEFLETTITSFPIKNFKNEVISFKLLIKPELIYNLQQPEIREIVKEVIVEKPVSEFSAENRLNFLNSEFLSGVFHEILTPLNVIFGFTQEIIEGLPQLTQEQKEAVEIISQNRTKLLDTMNSVVEYSELITSRSQLNLSEFRFVDLVEKLEKQAKDISLTHGIQFTFGKISSSLKIQSDSEKLERVILGLIKIVCRLTQEKKIFLSAFPLNQDLFFISITDQYNSSSKYLTGALNKIFNLFVEPRDVSAPRLTVYLTRFFMSLLKIKFVEQIQVNDKIEYGFLLPIKLTKTESNIIEDKKDKTENKQFITDYQKINTSDLTFTKEDVLTKPIATELTKEKPSEPKFNISSLTCLYIEDQVDSQVLFKMQMKELKEIVFVSSFENALPYFKNKKFDFIVIDINLEGEYNGLDALKLIRKIPGYEKIPIFASTAYILPGNKERFISAGFTGFIDKPIFKEKIIESLSKAFQN